MSRRVPFGSRMARGFTLPEILMALIIMAFAVAVFGASFPAASHALARSRNMDLASDACQQELEAIRKNGYAAIPSISETWTTRSDTFTAPSSLPNGEGTTTYTRLDGSYSSTSADTGRMKVDVRVSWAGSGANRGSVTLTTLVME